ncbi:hypothetical protein ABMA28_016273 [Loxostege sticticalis]|uniref:DNA-directed DNA polymerase n=1 Tax=Loxostege sticticalis TaxID=481309 RepID=A0ABD0T885_LOXSC
MASPNSSPPTSGFKRRSTNSDESEPKARRTSEEGSPRKAKEYTVNVELIQTAFQNQTSTYRITVESYNGKISDPQVILSEARTVVRKIIIEKNRKFYCLNVVFNIHGCFVDNPYDEFDISDTVIVIRRGESVDSRIQSLRDAIVLKYNNFDQDREGKKQLLYLDLHINEHKMTDNMFLDAPPHFTSYLVNVRASEKSFKYAVLAALHPELNDPKADTLEQYSNELILTDIEHPVKLHDIPKIEQMNDISFNVFITKYNYIPDDREEIEGPVYHTARRRNKHLNLLLLHDGPNDHYCYIKNLKGLVNPSKEGSICDGCLNFFESISLDQHQKNECLRMKTVIIPDDKKVMKMDPDGGKKMPIVVYADFEAFLEPVKDSGTKNRKEKETYTKNISKHIPYSFAYYIKCSVNDDLSKLEMYYGLDCAKVMIHKLRDDLANICRTKDMDDVSVIPVFFHNLSNYDGHFVCRVLDAVPGRINGLGSKHNFIAIHKTLCIRKTYTSKNVQLRFLDSCNFLKGSLEELAKSFDREKFIETGKYWGNSEKFELMTKKGSLPYEYINSLEVLDQTSLPPKEQFYSNVKDKHISDDDYQRALRVWEVFECRTIRDYCKCYAESDVLILADLFENLRTVCLDAYNLDPAKYFSISKLSWDAMLLKTGVELELLTDVKMITFILKAKRSGIAHCTRRHAVANNKKYLPETYDKTKEESFIMYYDANNLYGWAMSQPLPYGGFKWVEKCSVEWVKANILDHSPANSDIGYFLEVDLDYPVKLHDEHADLPFCPEKKTIPNCDSEKLVTDLTSKNGYILHHSYLIQCLNHGLVLKKVHRVLSFKQRPWLKQYIDYNTERRRVATTAVDIAFYKLMNNMVFGKSIQNDEKYFDLKIIDHWFKAGLKHGGHSLMGRADYHSHAVISEKLLAIQLNKTKRQFNTPLYIGISVYELSKAHMYEFHYNFMKKQKKLKPKLLYTDTDSFIYQIFTDDYYSEILDSVDERFDTSDYPEDSIIFSQENKKRVGYFKDEMNGDVVKEFVALRPKVYMIESKNKTIVKAAGVPKDFQKFTIDDYKRCLYKQEKIYKVMTRIKPVGYDIYTQEYGKVVLSPAYSNRHVLDNFIDTLPFGHYSLQDK